MRVITPADVNLSREEILVFIHNAMVTLLQTVPDARVPHVYYYKDNLVKFFRNRRKKRFTTDEIALVLAAAAYDLFKGEEK